MKRANSLAARESRIRSTGTLKSRVPKNLSDGVDCRIDRLDLPEVRFYQFDRRYLTPAHHFSLAGS